MKIQYTAVIFILIAIPIMLVVSYYMGLQIDSITLQTTYNTKLLASTKAAIESFEINTVEWNNKFSDVANARRRNVEASINTFTQSLANNLGVSGANKEYIEAYIPAVLYTLYDGYYIYTPTDMNETIKNEKGQDALTKDEEIIYKAESGGAQIKDAEGTEYSNATLNPDNAKKTTEHTLLPFVSYSEQIGKMTISYTLDNYIKVSGEFSCDANYKNYGGDKTQPIGSRNDAKYVQEEGHLVHNKFDLRGKDIYNIEYDNEVTDSIKITPETLTENVSYKDGSIYKTESFKYIYIEDSQGDKSKLYYDETLASVPDKNPWFTVNSKNEITYLSDYVTNVTQYVYKKVSLPSQESGDLNRYINFYQVLNRR
ncbi:MAG: hypothetical protein E7310_02535 [Clostridiales bacterium]|nr:hypothetical protein [Clostridiales bacterium]